MAYRTKTKKAILRLQREGKRWIRWSCGPASNAVVFDPDNNDQENRRLGRALKANLDIHLSASPNTLYVEERKTRYLIGSTVVSTKDRLIDFITKEELVEC